MQNYKIKKIDVREKDRMLSSQKFRIYHGIRHYSFSDIFSDKYFCISDKDGRTNIVRKPLDPWSPVLLYTNYDGLPMIKTKNLVTSEYDKSQADVNKVFWYLSLSSFEAFLKRRDAISTQADKHFPSSKTYFKISKKINTLFHYDNLDSDFFIKNYNRLKHEDYQSGEIVLNSLNRNPIPKKWIKTAYLTHNNEITAIALLIDDLASVCEYNIAARRSNIGYGLLLNTQIIKHCCDRNYSSFDCGVSGKYGVYKDKLFLDSKSVVQEEDFFNKYGQSNLPRRIMRKMYQVINFTDMDALHHFWHHIVK